MHGTPSRLIHLETNSEGQLVKLREARNGIYRSQATAAATMLLPMLALLVLLRLLPLANAMWSSLRDPRLGATGYVGIDNYLRVLSDPVFLKTLNVTAMFTAIINPLQIGLALALAVLLSQRIPAVGLWRTLVFLPAVVPQAVSAIIWGIALRSDGIFNALLHQAGFSKQGFLTSPTQALWCIILILTWIGVGYWMVILIAGINDIPPELNEAAKVDGAGALRRFWHITLPQLRRPLLFVLVADTVANFLIFAPVQILTKGGPAHSSSIIMFDIFERSYITGDVPGASAATVLLVALVLSVVAIQFRLLPGGDD